MMIAISDLRLSLELGHSGYFNEAIETAGKNLLLQMENNGVLNDKTAESHFILGSFFIRKELFDNARKELLTSMFYVTSYKFCVIFQTALLF